MTLFHKHPGRYSKVLGLTFLALAAVLAGCQATVEQQLSGALGKARAEVLAAADAAEQCTDPAHQAAAQAAADKAKQVAEDLRKARASYITAHERLLAAAESRQYIERNIARSRQRIVELNQLEGYANAAAVDPDPTWDIVGQLPREQRSITWRADWASSESAALANTAVEKIGKVITDANQSGLATDAEMAELETLKNEATALQQTPNEIVANQENYGDHGDAKVAMTAGYQAQVRQFRAEVIMERIKIREWEAELVEQRDASKQGTEAYWGAKKSEAYDAALAAKEAAGAATNEALAAAQACGVDSTMPTFPDNPWYNQSWWDTVSP